MLLSLLYKHSHSTGATSAIVLCYPKCIKITPTLEYLFCFCQRIQMGYFRTIQGDFTISQGREKKCSSDNAVLIIELVRCSVLFDRFNYLAVVRWISSIITVALKEHK